MVEVLEFEHVCLMKSGKAVKQQQFRKIRQGSLKVWACVSLMMSETGKAVKQQQSKSQERVHRRGTLLWPTALLSFPTPSLVQLCMYLKAFSLSLEL